MKFQFDTTPERSAVMKRIRSQDTGIELRLRRALWAKGHRYRIHVKALPGSPDIVFPRKRVAVFCDSAFWHGKNWAQKQQRIKSNRAYWISKIEGNMKRDRSVARKLRNSGWSVLRFWEDDIQKNLGKCIRRIETTLARRDGRSTCAS
jgi:DNA mismatch endonuclease (patch repair protein)